MTDDEDEDEDEEETRQDERHARLVSMMGDNDDNDGTKRNLETMGLGQNLQMSMLGHARLNDSDVRCPGWRPGPSALWISCCRITGCVHRIRELLRRMSSTQKALG